MADNYHVLIVDDVTENLQVVSNILHSKNIDVSAAVSGKQALTAVEFDPPDLILLDISMPEMDGFQVCQHLKNNEKTKDIPIIYLTARNEIKDIINGFRTGAVDYVTKPFNIDELLSRVFTHLELKRSRDIINEQNEHIRKQNQQILEQNEHITQQNQQLKELNSTKDKFFSIIAHDLKNPFHVLNNLSKLLINNYDIYDKERSLRFLYSMQKTSNQGYSLLENLLEWSRSQTHRLEITPEPLNLCEMIEVINELFSSNASSKNIQIINQIPEETTIFADEPTTKTVLRNLVSNAIKFTNSGGSITVSAIPYDRDMIAISVEDTGMGIPTEDIPKLFRIDVQYTTVGTGNEQGTGLGLILCKEFVNRNGGEIWVKSELRKGTCFTFTLPLLHF